jgi:16S rRNA (cytidine1402-2'-O)-methyltransferase
LTARRAFLTELATLPATVVLYESPKRVGALLGDLIHIFGEGRRAVVCRELTKRFEEVARGTVAELAERFATPPKGEIVVLLDRQGDVAVSEADVEAALEAALETMSVKDAAEAVSTALGLPRRDVYQAALKHAKGK